MAETHDKYPWRKQVQERIEEYLIFILSPHKPLETMGSLDELTAEIERGGHAAQLRRALRELSDEYRTVVEVLDFKRSDYANRYPRIFPNWPRGRRKGLQQLLKIAPSTLEDWYAKAHDQMADSLGLKEPGDHHAHPRVRKALSDETKARRQAERQEASKPDWWLEVEEHLGEIGFFGFRIKTEQYAARVATAQKRATILGHNGQSVTLAAAMPPDPRQKREEALALVHDVLTDEQSKNLIADRYWDPNVNQTDHPHVTVATYAQRLGLGRTQYYKLWNRAMEKLAAYWSIPIEEDSNV